MLNALRKSPFVSLVALLVVGLLVWGFWPQPVLVETVAVKRAPMTVTIEEEGRTRVIDRYTIAAPVTGVTCRVRQDVGDPVEQGQVLLTIAPLESGVLDPRSRQQAQSQVAAAQAALRAAEQEATAATAARQLATAELKRLRPLREQGMIAADEFDRAKTQVDTTSAAAQSADFKVEVARYELESARTLLDYTAGSQPPAQRVAVRSPVDGRILRISHQCEAPVQTGEPLLEVGDPSRLEVEVDVLSSDAVRIRPGMAVRFDRWGGDEPLQGVVRVVEPVGFTKISALGVEEQRVLIICDFTSPADQWRRLGDGYRVEAQFILWHEDDVLQVPASSLFRYRDGWAVFVNASGRATRRAVEVGQRNGLIAQITDGLQMDEQVINHPSDEVEEGRRIEQR
jgi:HlyD family secretion protein